MSAAADVLVVGAGPAGSSAAWHLARAGARVTLLDRARFPRGKPCAEYLSPEASRVLHAMGVLESCERAGAAQLVGMSVRGPAGEWAHGRFISDHGYRPFRARGLALRRVLLDAILLGASRDAGVHVEEGTQVTDVLRDRRGAVAGVHTIEPGGAAAVRRAALVIGADGLRSVVGRRLGLTRFARRPRRLAFVTHYERMQGMGSAGEIHIERDGYLGLASVDQGLTNVVIVTSVDRARAARGRAEAFCDEWIGRRPHLAPRFGGAVRVAPMQVTGPFAQHARCAWMPGAALVGDAADFFDPATGEGIYAALRGGELLAPFAIEALGAHRVRAGDAALAEYERARRVEFGGKWKVERLVGLVVGTPWLADRAARSLAAHPEMADLLVGVGGDFVPPREVLSLRFLARVLLPGAPSRPMLTPAP